MSGRVLDRRAAADFLGLSESTLSKWAAEDPPRGPRFAKIPGKERISREGRSYGRPGRVLYREEDLLAWLEDMTVPTVNPVPVPVFPTRTRRAGGGG